MLTRHWRDLGLSLDTADFTDTQAIAAIARITSGNFRLLNRLFTQIERIMRAGFERSPAVAALRAGSRQDGGGI